MKRHRVIVWFRQDLRVADNEALTDAIRSGEEVIPIYVFDPRVFGGKTKYGFPKTNKFRLKFIIESVIDLKASLAKIGLNLLVRTGLPEDEIFDLARKAKTSWVFCNRERTSEEKSVQDNLEKKLWSVGQEIIYSRGKMLYYTQDLPFPVTHCPDVFTQFRKEVEKITAVRDPLPIPEPHETPVSVDLEPGEMPSLASFGFEDFESDPRAVLNFKGGESAALERLDYYFHQTKLLSNYKETRNGLIGGDYSSKFSSWLAQGCISPKTIYKELKNYEARNGSNKSTYWLFFELLWRDYFRLIGKKFENKIFQKGGTKQEVNPELKDDVQLLKLWTEGRTGMPFIDANMKELMHTGFMSNRGRQNVASFLVKDLKVNWQMGAEYFESFLLDYDPCSNWCNWNYVAGVGSDPREDRYFNILSQAKKYDPEGKYVKLWLPELTEVPSTKVHRPDTLSDEEQLDSKVRIGSDYPKPMINTGRWA